MKKITAYLLFALFFFSVAGYYPVFLFWQFHVKKEIKQKIKNSVPPNEMVVFSFSKKEYSELRWKKKEKEFHYKNSMYDIVKKTTDEKENIILYCINDTQEKQLFIHLDEHVKKNSSTDKTAHKIFKLLSNISEFEKIKIAFIPEEKKTTHPEFYSFFLSFIGEISSPPPKTV